MASFIKHYILKYTPLSPVHIGADETYEPGNYVIDDEAEALFSFDTQAAVAGLEDRDKQQLLSIVNAKPDDEMLTRVQAFFDNQRDKLIPFARPAVPIATGVADLYRKRIGKTAQHEGRGRRVINKLEIERTFYNPVTGEPLFPGSSIKGAIRTALLDRENKGRKPKGIVKNQRFQADLFQGSFHSDPLRLISVDDAQWQGPEQLPACRVNFAVNRKREPVLKDGKLVRSQAETKGLYQLLECVANQGYQSLQGTMRIHEVGTIRQDDRKLPKKDLQWSIRDIAEACNGFYFPLFQRELEKINDRNYLAAEWLDKIQGLLQNGLLKQMANGEVFLLRLGRHSGAEGLTLNGARSIKIMQGKNKPSWEKEPKTWWLAAETIDDKNGMLPFGWVLVEIDPQVDKPYRADLQQGQTGLAEWSRRQSEKQTSLRQKIEERQAIIARKKEQEEWAERQAQELARREQQRLASLTPLERELEEFLQPIQVQDRDTRLLQELQSGRWKEQEAKQVAERVKQLMQEAGKWLPDFAGTNKKKLKLKERSLIVQSYLD